MNSNSFRDLAYVLKAIPFRERDLVVVLFTENHGKFSAIARNGVQSRRFGGSLDLFIASDFEIDTKTIRLQEVSEEGLVQLISAQHRHTSASQLAQHFEKLSAASCLNEIILKALPTHKPAREVFKLYSNCLMSLGEVGPEKALPIVNAFILKFTQWLGVQPSLTRCLSCEKTLSEVRGDGVYGQIAEGAWLCVDCEKQPDKKPEKKRNFLSKTLMLDAYHAMLHPIRKTHFEAEVREHEALLNFLEQHLIYFVPGLDRHALTSTQFLKPSHLLNA